MRVDGMKLQLKKALLGPLARFRNRSGASFSNVIVLEFSLEPYYEITNLRGVIIGYDAKSLNPRYRKGLRYEPVLREGTCSVVKVEVSGLGRLL